jgi:hypothetical protein
MHHNGDDAGAQDSRSTGVRASSEDSRFECLGGPGSRATTTFGGPPYQNCMWFAIVVGQLLFGSLLLSAYSISLDLSKRGHPLAAGSASLEMALSARVSFEYQFDLELTCPASAQPATA